MSDLCCCEYWDHEGERNHILACCCNCQDLDEGFEGLVSGRGVSQQNKRGILRTVSDRLRLPWLGGARQIPPDLAIPTILMPSLMILAANSLHCTILAFIILVVLNIIVYNYYIHVMPKFFLAWMIVSAITMYIIYETVVIGFLMILLEENIAVSVCMVVFIFFAFKTKMECNSLREPLGNEKIGERTHYCAVCQVYTVEGSLHRYWLDTCITSNNIKFYIMTLFSALLTLLYSSNLTLTSVCHPFKFFWTILLPDDCGEVYNLYELGISFVTAIYSLLLSVFIILELLISLRLCMCVWRKGSPRMYCRGFFCSCFRNICCYFSQYKHSNI